MKKMNLPNRLTLLRIILVPFVVAAMLIDFRFNFLVAGLLFAAASVTDLLDGRIARKKNLITDFGKFADPLADKILVISLLVCFIYTGWIGPIPVIIILFREFTVTSLRLVAASNGTVIAANMWGKIKTILQIAVIGTIFAFGLAMDILELIPACAPYLLLIGTILHIAAEALMWAIAIITIISGVKYLVDNRKAIADI